MYGYGYGRNSINMDTEYETTYSFGPSAYARKMSKSQKMMSVESEKELEEEAHEEEHEEEATQQNGENENTQREGNGRRRFEGKVAIITESNCGIDRAAAILMGKEGAKVTVQGTEEMELRRTIVLMVRQGVPEDNILVVQGSILEDQTLNRLVDKTIEKFERIDILVNNAVSENKNKKQQQQQREEEYDPYQNNNNYNSGSRYGNNTSSKFNNDYSQYNGTSDRRDSSRNTREKNNTISRYPGFQGFRRQSRFNAAGMYDTGGGSSRDFDSFRRHDDDFDFLFNINLKSITKLTRLCAPYLEDTKGAVVNVSSFGTQRAVHDYAYYNTIKSALDNYCRSIAIKFAKRAIRVNNVNPGFVTCEEMDDDEQAANKFELNWIKNHVPMGRGGAAEEIAKVIAFLASDDASYVTGATIVADGAVSIYSKPADFF